MSDPRDTLWWRLVNLDPAVLRGFVMALAALLAALGITFGDGVVDAIAGLVLLLLPILQGLWTKRAVTPNAKVAVVVPDPVNAPNTVAPGPAVTLAPHDEVVEAARSAPYDFAPEV